MEYIIANDVKNITPANHLVYTPLVLTKSITDNTAINVGPNVFISPNGTRYPPIYSCVVPKYSAIFILTLKSINITSTINTTKRIMDDALVDLPSVLYTSYMTVGSSRNIIIKVLSISSPVIIPIRAIIVTIVQISGAFLVGFAILC